MTGRVWPSLLVRDRDAKFGARTSRLLEVRRGKALFGIILEDASSPSCSDRVLCTHGVLRVTDQPW
jgi:hypothetical protein